MFTLTQLILALFFSFSTWLWLLDNLDLPTKFQNKKCISNSKAAAVSVVSFSYHLCRWQELIESPASTRNALLSFYKLHLQRFFTRIAQQNWKQQQQYLLMIHTTVWLTGIYRTSMSQKWIHKWYTNIIVRLPLPANFPTRIAQKINYNKGAVVVVVVVVVVVRSGLYNLSMLMFKRSAQQFMLLLFHTICLKWIDTTNMQ